MENTIIGFLKQKSIIVPSEWISACIEFIKSEYGTNYVENVTWLKEKVLEQWLHTDLTDLGSSCLPFNISCEKSTLIKGTFALQINQIKDVGLPAYSQLQKLCKDDDANVNVSADKQFRAAWEPKPSRMLMLQLTDGTSVIQGMEYKTINSLSLSLKPGVKIVLKGIMEVRRGVILLSNHHVSVLGGEVESLLISNAPENVMRRSLALDESERPSEIPKSFVANETIDDEQNSQYYNTQFTQNQSRNGNTGVSRQTFCQPPPRLNPQPSAITKQSSHQPANSFDDDFDDFMDAATEMALMEAERSALDTTNANNNMMNESGTNSNSTSRNNFNSNTNSRNNFDSNPFKRNQFNTYSVQQKNASNPTQRKNLNSYSVPKDNFNSDTNIDNGFNINSNTMNRVSTKNLDPSVSKIDFPASQMNYKNDVSLIVEDDDDDILLAAVELQEDNYTLSTKSTLNGGNHNMGSTFNAQKSRNLNSDIFVKPSSINIISKSSSNTFSNNQNSNLNKYTESSKSLSSPLVENSSNSLFNKPKVFKDNMKTKESALPKISKPSTSSFKEKLSVFKREIREVNPKKETLIIPENSTYRNVIKESSASTNVNFECFSLDNLIPNEQMPETPILNNSENISLNEKLQLHQDPFQYICYLDMFPLTKVTYVIKGFVTTLLSKLEQSDGKWSLSAKINDGTGSCDVDIDNQVLTDLMGMSVDEFKVKKEEAMTIPSLRASLGQRVMKCQMELIRMCCLLEVVVDPASFRPRVTQFWSLSPLHLQQIKDRAIMLRNS